MQFYTVHEPPEPAADRIDRAADLVFVGDKFTPAAVAFGPFWLLGHKLWHAFALYAAVLGCVALVVLGLGFNARWIALAFSALNLIVAFEAASLRRWALERVGWRTLGTVSGRSLDECERRFLEGWLPDQRMTREQEFVATVNTLRGSGLAGLAGAGGLAAGELRDTGERRRSWLPWRAAR